MANIKISDLSNAGALNGTEVLPIVQGNATVKTTTQNIANLLGINYTPENVANKDTDTTLSANSDTKYPSQKAVKTYVDSTVVSAITDNGNWDASSGFFPNVNAQGQPIQKGDLWYISVAGTLGGNSVLPGYSIRALVNNPAQNATNWGIINVGYGFTPENVANKSTDGTLSANSDTLYPSQKAVRTYVNSISVPTPTLSQVTSAGATTTSNIQVGQVSTTAGSSLQSSGDLLAKNIVLRPVLGSNTNQLTFDSSSITGTKIYTLPNASGTIALLSSISATSPLSYNSGTGAISMPQASTSQNGFLSSGDWNTFNNKQNTTAKLTSLNNLTYSSTSFVKMTGANTFELDTNTYVTSSYLVDNYLSKDGGTMNGTLSINGDYAIQFGGTYSLGQDDGSIYFEYISGSAKTHIKSYESSTISYIQFPQTSTYETVVVGGGANMGNYLARYALNNPAHKIVKSSIMDDGTDVIFDSVSVAIGSGANADASAVLDLASNTKGFLPPRMTESQRNAIGSPATGLMIYQVNGVDGEGIYVKTLSSGWRKLAWAAL